MSPWTIRSCSPPCIPPATARTAAPRPGCTTRSPVSAACTPAAAIFSSATAASASCTRPSPRRRTGRCPRWPEGKWSARISDTLLVCHCLLAPPNPSVSCSAHRGEQAVAHSQSLSEKVSGTLDLVHSAEFVHLDQGSRHLFGQTARPHFDSGPLCYNESHHLTSHQRRRCPAGEISDANVLFALGGSASRARNGRPEQTGRYSSEPLWRHSEPGQVSASRS